MNISRNEVSQIDFVGTTQNTAKAIYTKSSANTENALVNILDIAVSNPRSTACKVVLYNSYVGASVLNHSTVTIAVPANQTVNISREIPIRFGILGTTGEIRYIYASANCDVNNVNILVGGYLT